MKKLIVIALASLFCLSFAGCSGSGNKVQTEVSKTDSSQTESSKAESSQTESSKTESSPAESNQAENIMAENNQAESGLMTVEEAVAYYSQFISKEDNSTTCRVYSAADTMVFEYTYKNLISEDNIENAKSALKAELEKKSFLDSMESAKVELKQLCGKDVGVKTSYLNTDGTLIYEKVF